MTSEFTHDDLDDLEVELAQVEQTLRLLDDDAVDPEQAMEWFDTRSTAEVAVQEAPDQPDTETLAEVVALPTRPAPF